MEEKPQPAGTGQVEMLNLACVKGLRSVKLHEIVRVRLLNPLLDSELKRALEVLGTKVSIYNESVPTKFPLLGLKFKNTSCRRRPPSSRRSTRHS